MAHKWLIWLINARIIAHFLLYSSYKLVAIEPQRVFINKYERKFP